MTSSGVFIVNFEDIWDRPFPKDYIVDFKQVNVSWNRVETGNLCINKTVNIEDLSFRSDAFQN